MRELFETYTELMRRTKKVNQIHEDEYHFDEGMGQTLDEHIAKLKADVPDITVEVRRDRDGFAIVKTKLQKKYKFDLDEILGQSVPEMKARVYAAMNEELKGILPEDIRQVDKEKMK